MSAAIRVARGRLNAFLAMTRGLVARCAAVAACAFAGAGPHVFAQRPEPAATRTILSIVGTNDLHGGIVERDGRGGIDVFAGYVNNLRVARSKDGGAALVLDAGDMFQGTLESNIGEGAAVVAAYNAIGYVAAAIGNHEFDFGPVGPAVTPRDPAEDPRGALKARAAEASFPFLAANLIDTSTGRPVDWPNVRPSVLVTAGSISVGVIGVITKDALAATISANTHGLIVAPLAPVITAEAAALRAKGAAVVVVAAHAGGRCSRFDAPLDLTSCSADSEIVDVIHQLPRGAVDVVVAGHTHAGMAHEVDGVRVIESFNAGRSFGRVDLTVDRPSNRVVSVRSFAPRDICSRVDPDTDGCDPSRPPSHPLVGAVYEDAPVVPDPAVAAAIAPAIDRVHELKASLLGITLDGAIGRAPVSGSESPLGNLFVDAMLASRGDTDVAINNTTGGLRTDLPAGPLIYGRLFEVFPFDNTLARFSLSGAELREVARALLVQIRGLPSIAGMSIRATCDGASLSIRIERPDGGVVKDDDRLSVLTTSFLATGGDRVFAPVMPADGFDAETGGLVRDVVADWLRRRGGHLDESQFVDRAHPRWTYPGGLPVTCARPQ